MPSDNMLLIKVLSFMYLIKQTVGEELLVPSYYFIYNYLLNDDSRISMRAYISYSPEHVNLSTCGLTYVNYFRDTSDNNPLFLPACANETSKTANLGIFKPENINALQFNELIECLHKQPGIDYICSDAISIKSMLTSVIFNAALFALVCACFCILIVCEKNRRHSQNNSLNQTLVNDEIPLQVESEVLFQDESEVPFMVHIMT